MTRKIIRQRFYRIGFSDEEASTLEKYAMELNMTYSEFVRQSVFDKVRKIEHPETETKIQSEIDLSFVEELSNKLDIQTKELVQIKEGIENNKITPFVGKYINSLETIAHKRGTDVDYGLQLTMETHEDLNPSASIVDRIHDLIQEHKALTLEELLDLTGYSETTILDVFKKSKLFSFDFNRGKWRRAL